MLIGIEQMSAYCYTPGSFGFCRITREQAVLMLLNNRTTVPYLSLPECCAAQLRKCRQQEFPSGSKECSICVKASAQLWGRKILMLQLACNMNTPEAAVGE